MKPPQREDNDRTQRHRQMERSQRKTDESFWNVFKHSLRFYHTSPDWTPPFRSPLFTPRQFFSVWPFSLLISGFLFKFKACDFPFKAPSSLFSVLMSISLYLLPPSLSFFQVSFFFAAFALLFENGKFVLSFQCRVGLLVSAVHDILLLVSPLPDLTTHYIYNVVNRGLQRNSTLSLAIISDRGVLKWKTMFWADGKHSPQLWRRIAV